MPVSFFSVTKQDIHLGEYLRWNELEDGDVLIYASGIARLSKQPDANDTEYKNDLMAAWAAKG